MGRRRVPEHDELTKVPHQVLDQAVRDDCQRELNNGDDDTVDAVRNASASTEDCLAA